MSDEEMEKALDVPFTFSRWCRSGLLERCECWRCRGERGEPVTEETNQLAYRQAIEADDHFNKRGVR